MKKRNFLFLVFIFLMPLYLFGTTWKIGPSQAYSFPSEVASLVQEGDTVQIDPGLYSNDVVVWTTNNLVIMGSGFLGNYAHIQSSQAAEDKGIWVVKGNNIQISNIRFSNCQNSQGTGAGLVFEGVNLDLIVCAFNSNQIGLKVDDALGSRISIAHSNFTDNGHSQNDNHNVDIGEVQLLEVKYCDINKVYGGHHINSAAQINLIRYNRIMDEAIGSSIHALNFKYSGPIHCVGNIMHQNSITLDPSFVKVGSQLGNVGFSFFIVANNTMINDNEICNFLDFGPSSITAVHNTIFGGIGTPFTGVPLTNSTNLIETNIADINLVNAQNYNYRLSENAIDAIDKGTPVGSLIGIYLGPEKEYFHPQWFFDRPVVGALDIGAYEFNIVSPEILVNGDTSLCTNEQTNLSVDQVYSQYLWSTGETSSSITVIGPGNYSVTVTDVWGDTGESSILIPLSQDCYNLENSVTFSEVEGNSYSNYPMQLCRPFMQGEIQDYPSVLLNGQIIPTQAKVTKRWEDGSVKLATINFVIDNIAPFETQTIYFTNQNTGKNTGFLSGADMLNVNFDFDAQIKLTFPSGQQFSASARDMIANGDFEYWQKGEIVTSIILADHSVVRKYDMGSDMYKSFRPIFHVSFWNDINHVEVRYIGEISNTEVVQDEIYALDLEIGNSTPVNVYSKSEFKHHATSRWTKKYFLNQDFNEAKLNFDNNIEYLIETKYVPNFDLTKSVTEATISSSYNKWLNAEKDLFDPGNWLKGMPAGGGRPEIGILSSWDVKWLYTGDWRMREKTLKNADLAAAWPMHLREGNRVKKFDRDTLISGLGKVISISDRPSFWFKHNEGQDPFPVDDIIEVGPVSNGDGWNPDNSHVPDPNFTAYLLTGEYWYLEQMYFWASFGASNSNGKSNGIYGRGPTGVEGGIPGAPRAQAWVLRNRIHTVAVAPDNTPEEEYFHLLTDEFIAQWEGVKGITGSVFENTTNWNHGQNNLTEMWCDNPLNYWDHGGKKGPGVCIDTSVVETFISPWMVNYLVLSLGRAEELGHPSKLLKEYIGQQMVDFDSDPMGSPYLIGQYRLPVKKKSTNDFFLTIGDMVTGLNTPQSHPDCQGLSAFFFSQISNQLNAVHNYATIAQSAAAQIYSMNGGAQVWDFYAQNTENWIHHNYDPKWAIIPRIPSSVAPLVSTSRPSNNVKRDDFTEKQDYDFKIYPNPAFGHELTILLPKQEELMKIEILDFTGKLVKTFTGTNIQQRTVNVSNLNEGMYFIRVGNGIRYSKFNKIFISN